MSIEERQGQTIETMQLEERRYPPPPEFAAQANAQADIYDQDWEDFWRAEGLSRLTWSKKWPANSNSMRSPRRRLWNSHRAPNSLLMRKFCFRTWTNCLGVCATPM